MQQKKNKKQIVNKKRKNKRKFGAGEGAGERESLYSKLFNKYNKITKLTTN